MKPEDYTLSGRRVPGTAGALEQRAGVVTRRALSREM
jgi:hypothetical protein